MLLSGYPFASGSANFTENIFFYVTKSFEHKEKGVLSSDYSEIW
jgi:hypothetical protein